MAEWIKSSGGFVGPDAFQVDYNCCGEPIFIGRANYDGGLIPGKIIHSHGYCFIPYNGQEIQCDVYEYLKKPDFGNLIWVQASNGQVPKGAIAGGRTGSGETLYIGRVYYNNCFVPGKIQTSQGCLCLPADGHEHCFTEYEALKIVYD